MLTPIVDEHERSGDLPRGVFAQLGAAGLLSLAQPEEWGGGGQPFEVYLQVLEELAARWAAVAVAVSVHSLSCNPLLSFGTDEQKQRWLPGMLSGDQIGAYSLSGAAGRLRCRRPALRRRSGRGRLRRQRLEVLDHARRPGRLLQPVRPHRRGSRGVSCFLIPADQPGLSFGKPEEKMGLAAVPTTSAFYDNAVVDAERRIGAEGQGCRSRSARWTPAGWASPPWRSGSRRRPWTRPARMPTSERPSAARSSTTRAGFLLADMAAAVAGARATYLDAARRRDAGRPYSQHASVAKLVATDAAMKVTTDAVQVLGGSATPATTASSATCARPRSPRFRGHQPDSAPGHRTRPHEHVITGA